jgi:hypothetical protein
MMCANESRQPTPGASFVFSERALPGVAAFSVRLLSTG